MGMFDYIRCNYKMPISVIGNAEYQTKDTPAQFMDHYEIRPDGTLWHQNYDIQKHSRVNKRWERVIITGEIVFYDRDFEFSAVFVDGGIKHINMM